MIALVELGTGARWSRGWQRRELTLLQSEAVMAHMAIAQASHLAWNPLTKAIHGWRLRRLSRLIQWTIFQLSEGEGESYQRWATGELG